MGGIDSPWIHARQCDNVAAMFLDCRYYTGLRGDYCLATSVYHVSVDFWGAQWIYRPTGRRHREE